MKVPVAGTSLKAVFECELPVSMKSVRTPWDAMSATAAAGSFHACWSKMSTQVPSPRYASSDGLEEGGGVAGHHQDHHHDERDPADGGTRGRAGRLVRHAYFSFMNFQVT
jgi:hypothetical protein